MTIETALANVFVFSLPIWLVVEEAFLHRLR